MRLAPVLLALAVVACKKSPGPTVEDAGTSAAPKAVEDFAPTPSTLSLLLSTGSDCVWLKLDVATERRRAMATVPGSCQDARTALSADGAVGVVWSPGKAKLHRLTLASGTFQPMPKPPVGELHDVGFLPSGKLVALTEQALSKEEEAAGKVTVEAETITLPKGTEGIPVVAHAFVHEGAAWKRLASVPSTSGWDYAEGVAALAVHKELLYRSEEALDQVPPTTDVVDAAALGGLKALAPTNAEKEDGWVSFSVGGTPVYAWKVVGELEVLTGLIAFRNAAGEPVRPPDYPFALEDDVSLQPSAGLLLVTDGAGGQRPRVYDVATARLLWKSDEAAAVTFWPTAAP